MSVIQNSLALVPVARDMSLTAVRCTIPVAITSLLSRKVLQTDRFYCRGIWNFATAYYENINIKAVQ